MKQVVISAVLKSLMNMVFIADLKKIYAQQFMLPPFQLMRMPSFQKLSDYGNFNFIFFNRCIPSLNECPTDRRVSHTLRSH